MANMFSGNQEKKIPKNFKDCYKTDSITQNLWLWCERLEKWGLRICIALAVIGIITIISEAIETAQLLSELNIDIGEIKTAAIEYGVEIKSVFEIVIEGILIWTFYCFLEYCAYHILALLVGSLATIVQHIKITANISLYNSAKAEGITDDIADDVANENTNSRKTIKCNNITHEKFISEIRNTETDSENAHWEESKLTGAKRLVCNHCGKELLYVDKQEINSEENTLSENYEEIRCPKCKQKLSIHKDTNNSTCPYCETDIKVK